MPNLSWMEMLVVGIVALIVIGPKDLPGMFRQVGQFVGKAKGMAREFSNAMNAAADEAGVHEINKTIKAAANPQKFGIDKIREATKMEKPVKPDTKGASETDKLRAEMSQERKATAQKMNDAMAKAATDRQAAEKAAAAEAKPAKAAPNTTNAKPKGANKAKTAKTTAPKAKAPAKSKTAAPKTPKAKAAKDAT